jgi:hypothetical protein
LPVLAKMPISKKTAPAVISLRMFPPECLFGCGENAAMKDAVPDGLPGKHCD